MLGPSSCPSLYLPNMGAAQYLAHPDIQLQLLTPEKRQTCLQMSRLEGNQTSPGTRLFRDEETQT